MDMKQIEICQANDSHMDILVKLNKEVQDIHVELFPDSFHHTEEDELRRTIASWLKDANFMSYIAYAGNIAVGYMFAKIIRRDRNPFSNARECIYIDQICVTGQFRNRGVAKLLIAQAVGTARKMGIKRVELDYWTGNKPAGKAFRKIGFTTYNEKMFLDIE